MESDLCNGGQEQTDYAKVCVCVYVCVRV